MTRSKDGHQAFCMPCHREANKKSTEARKQRPASIIRTSKTCGMCNRHLPVSQFGKNRQKLDKLMPYCKPCWTQYVIKAKKKMI